MKRLILERPKRSRTNLRKTTENWPFKGINKEVKSLKQKGLRGFIPEIPSDKLFEKQIRHLQKTSLKLLPKNMKLQTNQSRNKTTKNAEKTKEIDNKSYAEKWSRWNT